MRALPVVALESGELSCFYYPCRIDKSLDGSLNAAGQVPSPLFGFSAGSLPKALLVLCVFFFFLCWLITV